MGIIARLYDFVAGTRIRSAQVDAELDNLVAAHNVLDGELDALVSVGYLVESGVVNVKSSPYLASGLATTATGSITTGTKLLTLTTTPDFVAGHGINLEGVKEVASLQITAPASATANCTVTLNGVATTVALTSGATAVACATAIRAATYAGWTAGGTALSDTITFTSLSSGVKTDSSYTVGTTGATGTMTTTTQGTLDQISTVSSINGLVVNIADNATRTVAAGTISHDDTVAIQAAINVGGDIIFPAGTYYIRNTGSAVPLIFSKNHTRLLGVGDVKIIFDNTTKGITVPESMTAYNLSNLSLKNIYFQGHATQGATPTTHRLWGMGFYGCTNVTVEGCTFDTFEGHLFNGQRSQDTTNWIVASDKNSTASVTALFALNSVNVIVDKCNFLNAASTCCAFFGVTNGKVLNSTFDTTGALFNFACWTDDASQSTTLLNYSPNTNIEFIGNTVDITGSIRMYGCAKGIMAANICSDITYKSYDFDQQTNNFGATETTPFFWMNYTGRSILIADNLCNTIQTKTGGYVTIANNVVKSNSDSSTLALIGNNSILWPTAISYYDGDTTTANQNIRQVVANNTFIARHIGTIGISNLTSFTALNLWSEDNRFIVDGPGVFTTYDATLDSTRSYSYSYPGTGNASNKTSTFATTIRDMTATALKAPFAGLSLGDGGNALKVFDSINTLATLSMFWFVSADDLIYCYLKVLMAGSVASEYDLTISRSLNTVTPTKRAGGGTDTLTFAISAATGSRKSLTITNTGASRVAVECLAMSGTNLNQLYKKST